MISRPIYVTAIFVTIFLADLCQAQDSQSPALSDALAIEVGKQLGVNPDAINDEQLESMTELKIENAGAVNLSGITRMPRLRKLELHGAFLSDLTPLSTLVELEYLSLRNNRISDLEPLKPLTGLTYLNLDDNIIADCSPLGSLTKLQELQLNANAIEDLSPLFSLSRLESLYVNENRLNQLDGIEGLTKLSDLRLSKNSIEELSSLSASVKLKYLDLSHNKIKDVSPLNNLNLLESLWIQNNPISTLTPLAALSRLTELSVASSQLNGNLAPLSGLTKLTRLSCPQSHVRDLAPLRSLNRLTFLDLRNNVIESIQPLVESRASFETVYLERNPLDTLARAIHVSLLRNSATVSIDGELFESPMTMRRNFAQIDVNHDDKLSFKEARAFSTTLALGEFDALDTNGDWTISSSELAAFQVVLPNSMDIVWVGTSATALVSGTQDSPFGTLERAHEAVKSGGTIVVTPGVTLKAITLFDPLTIIAPEGAKSPGRIGGAESKPEKITPTPLDKEIRD